MHQALYRSLAVSNYLGYALIEYIRDSRGDVEDYRFIEVNPAYELMMGLDAGTVAGRRIRELIPEPEILARYSLLEHVKRVAGGQDSDPVEKVNSRTGRIYEVQISRVSDEQAVFLVVDVSRTRSAEREAQKKAEDLQAVLYGTRAGVWQWNVQTGETVFNERWAEILGYTLEELEPVSIDTWLRLAHPEDLKNSERLLNSHFSGELDYYECECRMKHRDGRWIWVRDRGRVREWNEDGSPRLMFGTHLDVTDAVQLRYELEYREKALQSIFEHSGDGFARVDRKGKFLYMNHSLAAMFGYERDEFTDRSMSDSMRSYSEEALEEMIETVYREKYFEREFSLKHRSGSSVELHVIAVPAGLEGQEDILLFVRNVTDRKRIQSDLLNANLRFQIAADSAGIGVWELDIVKGDLSWDAQMMKIYGIDQQEYSAVYEMWERSLHPEDRDRTIEEYEMALRGEKPFNTVFRIVKATGETRYIQGFGRIIHDLDGKPERMIGINYDVTRNKELEDMIRQTEKMESLGRLAGGIAHDFNNILAGQYGLTDFLDSLAGENAEFLEPLSLLKQSNERAADLVRQLLTFSRRQEPQKELLDLNERIRMQQKTLGHLIGRDIQIELKLCEDEAWILADRTQLEQVFINLCVNARDAIHEKSEHFGEKKILIETQRAAGSEGESIEAEAGRYCVMSVIDRGVGMDSALLNKIFDPFYTSKGKDRGTGLGLATVDTIVRDAGGFIRVQSEPGEGSRFDIWWPVSENADLEAGTEEETVQVYPRVEGTVLLAEDDDLVRLTARSILEDMGLTVVACRDGLEALEQFQGPLKGKVDLLLTDLVMPKMNGIELIKQALNDSPQLKILVVTGQFDEMDYLKTTAETPIPYLMKPYTINDLRMTVAEIMGFSE